MIAAHAVGILVGAVVLGSETDTQYDDGSHPDARTLARTSLVGITGSQRLGERTSLVLRVGESRDRSEAISSFPGLFTTVQRQAAATIVHAPARGVEASAGYERLEQNVTSSGYAPGTPGRRTTDSLLASIAATTRSTPTSSHRRPLTCTPTSRPSASRPPGTVAAGCPDMLYGAVYPMCAIPRSSSGPHGIGHSAGKAAMGATGESTTSYAEVAAIVAARMAWVAW